MVTTKRLSPSKYIEFNQFDNLAQRSLGPDIGLLLCIGLVMTTYIHGAKPTPYIPGPSPDSIHSRCQSRLHTFPVPAPTLCIPGASRNSIHSPCQSRVHTFPDSVQTPYIPGASPDSIHSNIQSILTPYIPGASIDSIHSRRQSGLHTYSTHTATRPD